MIPFFTRNSNTRKRQDDIIQTLDEFETALPTRNPEYITAKKKIKGCREELASQDLQDSLVARKLHELVREIGAMLYLEKLVFTPKQMKIWERLKSLQNPCQQVSWGY